MPRAVGGVTIGILPTTKEATSTFTIDVHLSIYPSLLPFQEQRQAACCHARMVGMHTDEELWSTFRHHHIV